MGKKNQASQPALQTLKRYAAITAAVLIMDIGIYVFKFPNNFLSAVSGMAVVICRFSSVHCLTDPTFCRLPAVCWLVLLCWGGTGVKTAYVTVLSSVLLNIFEKLFPMAHPLADERTSVISSVSGCAIGNSFSKMFRRTEESTVT